MRFIYSFLFAFTNVYQVTLLQAARVSKAGVLVFGVLGFLILLFTSKKPLSHLGGDGGHKRVHSVELGAEGM